MTQQKGGAVAHADPVPGPGTCAVIVTGMHRSGTSLVARVLHDCGLELGAEDDLLPANAENTEGFWENTHFVEVNDAVLAALGGAWDRPPSLPDGWKHDEALEPIRKRAEQLVRTFDGREAWGWKDPRTSLTLPFWSELLPDARVVVCVRHPLEVARSLESRGPSSYESGLGLWRRYNEELLAALRGRDALVTHYDSYFQDAEAEVRRLLAFAGLEPAEEVVLRAAARVNGFVRHHDAQRPDDVEANVPADVAELYRRLCDAASPVLAQARSAPATEGVAETPRPRQLAPVSAAGRPNQSCKYSHFDDSPGSTHRRVVELVPPGARVLEFGCATGYMSRVLRDQKRCEVTGIEISPTAAEQAAAFCKRVIVGDAEALDLSRELGGETFDAVLFADVLEHLRDPGGLLGRVRPFVAEGGTVIASIPNVAHGSVRLALLAGDFRYRPLGLLDDTHLRFFTRATIEDLFETSGYIVLRWLRQHAAIDDTEIDVGTVPDELLGHLAADPDATTYQFVVQAVPSDASHHLVAARQLLDEARGELEELRPLKEETEAMRVELERLRRAHHVLTQRLAAERVAMSNRVQELEDDVTDMARMQEEIDWRTAVTEQLEGSNEWLRGVTERLEREIATFQGSRSYRYTAPLRKLFRPFRRRS